MSISASRHLREVIAGLIYSPLYFNLAPVQRLSLVKSLANHPCLRPRAYPNFGPKARAVATPRPYGQRVPY